MTTPTIAKDKDIHPASISQDEMANLVVEGQAKEWTHPLGGSIPAAARLGDTWYVVLDGNEHYEPATEHLTALLAATHAALSLADEIIAEAEAQPA
jgi:hypothetical protein